MNPKWLHRYRLALRFASFFDSDHRYDIVHEGWIYYMDKESIDLFDMDLKNESSYIYTVIKKAFYRWWYRERKDKEKYKYVSAYNDGEITHDTKMNPDILRSKFNDPEESLIGKDLYEVFYKKLFLATKPTDKRHYRTDSSRQLPMDIFRLKAEGYTQKEISDQLEVSKQLVHSYINKIEQMAGFTNPFNGSKTIVKKRISETSWDKRKDHDDFDFEDENEYLKLYIHKESKEGWLIITANPKGSEYYIKKLENSSK